MKGGIVKGRALAAGLAMAVIGWTSPILGQKKPVVPAGKSPAAVKELDTLLEGKKVTHFAAVDPADRSHYVAMFYAPGVQIMLVSAKYDGTDIDYYIYNKDYATAFNQLKLLPGATERFVIEDLGGDGLVPQPPKGMGDTVTIGTAKQVYDGDFSDTRVVNTSKVSLDEYTKRFVDADAKYTQALGVIIAGLKK